MSHRFKRPAPVTEEECRATEMRFLARHVPDQETLDRILDDCRPGYRAAAFEMIRPHLTFANPVDREAEPALAP
jgi:hypothetical protein